MLISQKKPGCVFSPGAHKVAPWSVLLENNIGNYFPDHWLISWNSSISGKDLCGLNKNKQKCCFFFCINWNLWTESEKK